MKNFNDKLPKTQKQWLHFILKAQAKINKLYKEYVKNTPIETWMKKVKNVKPKYYSVNVMKRCIGEEIPSKPSGQRSFAVVYEKEGLKIQRTCYGMDEGDIRDRGNYYNISVDGITVSFHNYMASRPLRHVFFGDLKSTITVNGIEVKSMIDGWSHNQKEFLIENDGQVIIGTINGHSYDVYTSKPGMFEKRFYLLKCMRRQEHLDEVEKAVREFFSGWGEKYLEKDTRKDGYRYRDEIEADPE